MSGTGKTSVGSALARRMNRRFVDLDEVIVQSRQMSIRAIFERAGEETFRRLEREALLDQMRENGPAVIALGGGTLLDPALRQHVRVRGALIGLEAETATIAERLTDDRTRPLLLGGQLMDQIQTLKNARVLDYQDVDLLFSTDGLSVHQVVEKLVAQIRCTGLN